MPRYSVYADVADLRRDQDTLLVGYLGTYPQVTGHRLIGEKKTGHVGSYTNKGYLWYS